MIKKIAKSIFLSYKEHLYHKSHKVLAKEILKKIETRKGVTNYRFIKLSNEYATDVLGWIGFAPWLYVYCAVSESFKEGWIPDNYYSRIVAPRINGPYADLQNFKALSRKLFETNCLPDIAYYVNGLYFSKNHYVISEEKIKEILFEDSNTVLFKIDRSFQGKGIFFYQKSQFSSQKIKSHGNGVFQSFIEQHDFFKTLSPSAVATLRLTTVMDDLGEVSLRACYLRIGLLIDSHIKSISHIRIPVNLKTGELSETGFLPNWISINHHPDTNISFNNKQIPFFPDCQSTVISLHLKMPFTRVIGWDITINKENQIKVMEWNSGHNDIKFSEATQGPCFLDLRWEHFWRKTIP